jgi:hypothetical protein
MSEPVKMSDRKTEVVFNLEDLNLSIDAFNKAAFEFKKSSGDEKLPVPIRDTYYALREFCESMIARLEEARKTI